MDQRVWIIVIVIVAVLSVRYYKEDKKEDVDFDLVGRCHDYDAIFWRGTNMTFIFEKCKDVFKTHRHQLGILPWRGNVVGFAALRRPCFLLDLPDEWVTKRDLVIDAQGQSFEWNIFHAMSYAHTSDCVDQLVSKFPHLVLDTCKDRTPFSFADHYLRTEGLISDSDKNALHYLKKVFKETMFKIK